MHNDHALHAEAIKFFATTEKRSLADRDPHGQGSSRFEEGPALKLQQGDDSFLSNVQLRCCKPQRVRSSDQI